MPGPLRAKVGSGFSPCSLRKSWCGSSATRSRGEDAALDACSDIGKSCCMIGAMGGDGWRWVRPSGPGSLGSPVHWESVYFAKRHSISDQSRPAVSTLAVVALPSLARAQSGSAGGSIGNDEKSLSGSRETPRAAEPSKPARRSKPETEAPSRASRNSGGGGNGGGNFNGAWVLTSVGTPCGTSTDAVVITGGRMVGQYGTAQVSPNGSTSGIGSAGSLSWTMSGRFSGRSGSGTFRRSDGCAGSWTGAKQ